MKIGKLKECRFDRNEFGQFLGSATVVFDTPTDADKAIDEYHRALLDNKVLTVEHDLASIVNVAKFKKALEPKGKTLRLGPGAGRRGGRQ